VGVFIGGLTAGFFDLEANARMSEAADDDALFWEMLSERGAGLDLLKRDYGARMLPASLAKLSGVLDTCVGAAPKH